MPSQTGFLDLMLGAFRPGGEGGENGSIPAGMTGRPGGDLRGHSVHPVYVIMDICAHDGFTTPSRL
jgi:hypothetical protein